MSRAVRAPGWCSLKASKGARLTHGSKDEAVATSVGAWEGLPGTWKDGILAVRIWRQATEARPAPGNYSGHYTATAYNADSDVIATATGVRDAQVWRRLLHALVDKGYPDAADEVAEADALDAERAA